MTKLFPPILCCIVSLATVHRATAQSADWTDVIFREPQVRYLLADMTGGGKVEMVYTAGDRGGNYIHINGSRITGSGGLTVNTFAGGAKSWRTFASSLQPPRSDAHSIKPSR
ncbi:MAG: hypothetical protein ABI680_20355 [Chthoniobacteraceae bacterium]